MRELLVASVRRRNLIVGSWKEAEAEEGKAVAEEKESEDREGNERLLMALSTKTINFLFTRTVRSIKYLGFFEITFSS